MNTKIVLLRDSYLCVAFDLLESLDVGDKKSGLYMLQLFDLP